MQHIKQKDKTIPINEITAEFDTTILLFAFLSKVNRKTATAIPPETIGSNKLVVVVTKSTIPYSVVVK